MYVKKSNSRGGHCLNGDTSCHGHGCVSASAFGKVDDVVRPGGYWWCTRRDRIMVG